MLKSTLKNTIVSIALASLLTVGAFASQKYTVVGGDTVSDIAAKFNVPTKDILAANNMSKDDTLDIGKTLIIPSGKNGSIDKTRKEAASFAHTNSDNVTLRKGPSKTSAKIAVLPKNAKCKILDRSDKNWAKVSVNGHTGYIFRDLLSSGSVSAALAAKNSGVSGTVHTNADNVNLRKSPSKTSARVATLPKNATCKVLDRSDKNWAKVSVNGHVGYIFKEFLSSGSAPAQQADRSGTVTNKSRKAVYVKAHTNTDDVVLRSGPSKDSAKKAVFAKNIDFTVVERTDENWAKVKSETGHEGYMFRKYLSAGPAPAPVAEAKESQKVGEPQAQAENDDSAKPATGSRNVVGTAMACRGSRYRRGGTGRGGFDCSGFTSYVFRQHGITLPRTSSAQSRVGSPVSKSDLQPGDLVFFNTRGRGVSHVAIYIGDNKIVHASSVRTGVKVDSLSSAYYAKRYHSARRVKKG